MPTINGVTFTELDGSCHLGASRDGMTGTRVLDCAWEDRKDATEALLGRIVVTDGVRQTILPPDTFPGYDNLEVDSLNMEGVGLTGEDADGGAAYDLARFTVTYKVLEFSQDSESNGDNNAGQFYDTEEINYEGSFVTMPGGTYSVNGDFKTTKLLDMTARPIVILTHTFTKNNLSALPSFADYINKVNDAAFPPGKPGAVAAGKLLFAGAVSNKKVDAQGGITWDVKYVFKEREESWNETVDPDPAANGAWAPITPAPFSSVDFSAIGIG